MTDPDSQPIGSQHTGSQRNSDHDSPWKDALEWYFAEFLALLFPDVETEIDWSRGYSFLDKELQQVSADAKVMAQIKAKRSKAGSPGHRGGQEDALYQYRRTAWIREGASAKSSGNPIGCIIQETHPQAGRSVLKAPGFDAH